MKAEILNFLNEHKLSTTEVADAMGKKGLLPGIHSINQGHIISGEVAFLYANDGSNWNLHKGAADVAEDKIIFVQGFNCGEKALFGELVCQYLLDRKRARGIIIDGYVRDVHALVARNFPVWATGRTPIGCVNSEVETVPEDVLAAYRERLHNKITVCDDSGVVLVESADELMLEKLKKIKSQEETWFKYLSEGKSTFDIVCQKNYENQKLGNAS